jgi:hypothetical protein
MLKCKNYKGQVYKCAEIETKCTKVQLLYLVAAKFCKIRAFRVIQVREIMQIVD